MLIVYIIRGGKKCFCSFSSWLLCHEILFGTEKVRPDYLWHRCRSCKFVAARFFNPCLFENCDLTNKVIYRNHVTPKHWWIWGISFRVAMFILSYFKLILFLQLKKKIPNYKTASFSHLLSQMSPPVCSFIITFWSSSETFISGRLHVRYYNWGNH